MHQLNVFKLLGHLVHIQDLQVKRNKLRFEAHKTSDDSVWNAFREVRNTLKTKIKSAKRRFFPTALSSKKIWKVIHSILNPSPQPLRHDPNELNIHFTSTVQRTLGHSTNTGDSDLFAYIDSLPVNVGEKFQLKRVSQAEVFKELLNLRNDSSTGPDQIPTRYIKPVADIIAAPLTYIINTCIQSNIFPEAWKITRISPISKTEVPKNNDDFRPIAILPVLSKIYERLVLKQQLSFIDNRINDNMSGFRKGHSTATILMSMRDDIMRAMKKGELKLMLLAHFPKTFDTLNFKEAPYSLVQLQPDL